MEPMNKKDGLNLLEGNLVKTIIKLGYPMALAAVAQTLYNLADTFWLGKLGKEALSAPVISFILIFFVLSIGIGFSVAGTSLVAQYIGAGEKEKAYKSAGNLLTYLVLFSVLFGFIGVILDKQLLGLLKRHLRTHPLLFQDHDAGHAPGLSHLCLSIRDEWLR